MKSYCEFWALGLQACPSPPLTLRGSRIPEVSTLKSLQSILPGSNQKHCQSFLQFHKQSASFHLWQKRGSNCSELPLKAPPKKNRKDKGENIREATATQTDANGATTALTLQYGGFLLKLQSTFTIKDKESTALKAFLGEQVFFAFLLTGCTAADVAPPAPIGNLEPLLCGSPGMKKIKFGVDQRFAESSSPSLTWWHPYLQMLPRNTLTIEENRFNR